MADTPEQGTPDDIDSEPQDKVSPPEASDSGAPTTADTDTPESPEQPEPSEAAPPWWKRPSTVVGLAAVIGLAIFYQNRVEEATRAAPAAKPKPPKSVATIEVPTGTVRRVVVGQGTVRAAKRELLTFEQQGKVVFIGRDGTSRPLRAGSLVKGPKVGEEAPAKDEEKQAKKGKKGKGKKGKGKKDKDVEKPEGQFTAGQLLARIDAREQQQGIALSEASLSQSRLDVQQARAGLTQSKTDLTLARADLRRTEELYQTGEASTAQLEQSRAKVRSQQAAVAARRSAVSASRSGVKGAKAQLGQSELTRERTEIRAPFDGLLAAVNLRLGDFSGPNAIDYSSRDREVATAPFILIDPSEFEAVVELPASAAESVKPGQPAVIMSATVSLRDLDKQRGTELSLGFVDSVDQVISPSSRTSRVTIRTRHNTHLLKDGQFVSCVIVTETARNVPVVPVEALLFRDNQAFTFVLDASGKTVERRRIVGGVKSIRTLEVKSGVSAGDTIVTDGRHRLTTGSAVAVVRKDKADIGWQGEFPDRDHWEPSKGLKGNKDTQKTSPQGPGKASGGSGSK